MIQCSARTWIALVLNISSVLNANCVPTMSACSELETEVGTECKSDKLPFGRHRFNHC